MFLDQKKRGESNIYIISKRTKIPYPTVFSWAKEWEKRYVANNNKLWQKFLIFLKKYLTK